MDSELLKKVPIFKGLSASDLEKLGNIIEEKPFPAGHRLFRTGDPPDAFYIIKKGSVRIVREEAGGPEIEVATLREGDFFGEMGVIEGSPRMAGAVLAEAGELFEVEAHEFHRFMAINPTISMKIMSTMSKRYRVKTVDPGTSEAGGRTPGSVIGLFTATGGCGLSLVTANLAAAIKRLHPGKQVAVLDMNLMFGDQSAIFNVKVSRSLSALAGETEIGMDTLDRIVETTQSGVDLIPSPQRPEEAEAITPDLVRVVLEVLRSSYDYVLVDTANSVAEVNLSLMESADRRLYVMTPEVLAIKNALRWFAILDLLAINSESVDVVLNKELKSDQNLRENVEKSLRHKVLGSLPFDHRAARQSLDRGALLVQNEPEIPLAEAHVELARLVTGVAAGTKPEVSKSFWARLGLAK